MSRVLAFFYGHLKSGYEPLDTMSWAEPDAIHGELYHLQEDAAAINIGISNDSLIGETQEIDDSELPSLDAIEAPEYERITTTTLKGYKVFVYKFNGTLPLEAYKVQEWHF